MHSSKGRCDVMHQLADSGSTVHVFALDTGSLLDDSHPDIDLNQIRDQAFDKMTSAL